MEAYRGREDCRERKPLASISPPLYARRAAPCARVNHACFDGEQIFLHGERAALRHTAAAVRDVGPARGQVRAGGRAASADLMRASHAKCVLSPSCARSRLSELDLLQPRRLRDERRRPCREGRPRGGGVLAAAADAVTLSMRCVCAPFQVDEKTYATTEEFWRAPVVDQAVPGAMGAEEADSASASHTPHISSGSARRIARRSSKCDTLDGSQSLKKIDASTDGYSR